MYFQLSITIIVIFCTSSSGAMGAMYPWPSLQSGSNDYIYSRTVHALQYLLNYQLCEKTNTQACITVDGSFGSITNSALKTFQQLMGLNQTGITSAKEWELLIINVTITLPLTQNSAVKAIQDSLNLTHSYDIAVDGTFGNGTQAKIIDFQTAILAFNSTIDSRVGIVEISTWNALLTIHPKLKNYVIWQNLTLAQLQCCMPYINSVNATQFIGPLNDAMQFGGVINFRRKAAYLAQIAEESGDLNYWYELGNCSIYEGDLALCNNVTGDGCRFKGRGPIQLTGRCNYIAAGQYLGIDLVDYPDLAASPQYGFKISMWYWNLVYNQLNIPSDSDNFSRVTLLINGGYNGETVREQNYVTCKSCLPPDQLDLAAGTSSTSLTNDSKIKNSTVMNAIPSLKLIVYILFVLMIVVLL